MISIVAGLTATLMTIPLIALLAVYLISRRVIKNSKKSILLTVDLTTILFIFSVHYILLALVGQSYLWLIITVLLLTILIFTLIYWNKTREFNIKPVLKGFWRFSFFLFAGTYILLMISGVIFRIIKAY
ncbi:DUF3397 domain-containing protein [Litchfieldia alkalitelluris]|uniref:DUF3397 domain-containing protein n=1 Tax=Litchfieldia alkalitelluris TaxID=304268 RepID=UPI000997BBFA|nr:DUF3397 domain-containing protein [Litchfieldia alkalitelluris]